MDFLNQVIAETNNNHALKTENVVSLPIAPVIVSPTTIEPELPQPTATYDDKIVDFFTVESKQLFAPLSTDDEGQPVYSAIPKKKGLFVEGKNINIVSDKYEIHQPKAIAAKFVEVSKSHGLEIGPVLPNKSNGGLLMSAKFKNLSLGGDSTDVNLTFYTSHDGKNKTFLSLDTLRIACYNQLPALYKNKSRFIFSEKHYQNALDIDLIGEVLENIPASMEAHNEKLLALKETKLSLDDFVTLWQTHYKVKTDAKQYDTKVAKMRAIYMNAPGQQQAPQNSAYRALQAMTYANTHEIKNTALQLENSVIGGGNDSLKWMDTLLNIEYNEPELVTY